MQVSFVTTTQRVVLIQLTCMFERWLTFAAPTRVAAHRARILGWYHLCLGLLLAYEAHLETSLKSVECSKSAMEIHRHRQAPSMRKGGGFIEKINVILGPEQALPLEPDFTSRPLAL